MCLCLVGFLRRVVVGLVVLILLCFAVVRCCVLCWFPFFFVVPCLSVVLRAVSVSVLCLCGAVPVCLRRKNPSLGDILCSQIRKLMIRKM